MTAAVLMACEGAELGAKGEDARRLIWSDLIMKHKLLPQDPLASDFQKPAKLAGILLGEKPIMFKDIHDCID